MAELFANSGDPDQMPQNAASDMGLHCLPITLLRVSRLQWVKGKMPLFLQLLQIANDVACRGGPDRRPYSRSSPSYIIINFYHLSNV